MIEITPESLLDEAQHLFAFALKRVGDYQHAEDLVQECIVTAWTKRESFKGASTLSTWLFGIMKFKILDHHRAANRTPMQRSVSPSPEREGDTIADPLDKLFHASGAWKVDPNYGLEVLNESPDASANRFEVMEWVRRCFRRLPERARLLFTLRELDDLPMAEAAAAAGVTPGSAAVLLTRARHQLRACLQQHDITPWNRATRPAHDKSRRPCITASRTPSCLL